MALCNSGTMSLGGSTTGRSVNCELGRSGTSSINMNENDVRDLAGRSSGSICMSNFYGKSAFDPGPLGSSVCGGYYMGTTGSNYLIMAPNATGCAKCKWMNTRTFSNSNSETNGCVNTYVYLDNALHPAGNWTATRSIGGFSDWYLPAICEMRELYDNCNNAPAGQGFCGNANYWSSTADDPFNAQSIDVRNGVRNIPSKTFSCYLRAVRRVSF